MPKKSTATLTGKVTNAETSEPELGCAIVIVELNMWGMTDQNGNYTINKIPTGGPYTIQTSSLGS